MKTSITRILKLTGIITASFLLSVNSYSQERKEERKLPDGTIVYPDGTRKLPNGTIIYKGGNDGNNRASVPLPDGSIILPDGSRRYPKNKGKDKRDDRDKDKRDKDYDKRDKDDDKDKKENGRVYSYNQLGIPKGHLPPPGECKVWIPGTPPGQQGPPQSCSSASRNAPLGAWVITHEGNRYRVNIFNRTRRSVVDEVRYYETSE